MQVSNIQVCKLPYQQHPFVHGVRDGKDVWLTNTGEWTEAETDPACSLPLAKGLRIVSRSPGTSPPLVRRKAVVDG